MYLFNKDLSEFDKILRTFHLGCLGCLFGLFVYGIVLLMLYFISPNIFS